MLNIKKTDIPQELADYKKRNSPKNWDDYNHEIKKPLKEHMLLEEQNFCCVYCEKSISENSNDSHIEHIKPKGTNPKLFQDYNNLSVSCMSNTSCGNYKDEGGKRKIKRNYGENYENNFINPVIENPQNFLTYDIKTGKVIPKKSINIKEVEKAKITIEVLNLNESSLCSARKNQVININNMLSVMDNESLKKCFDSFPTLVEYILGE